MTQAQLIQGTTEEITTQLQQDDAGQRLRVFVELEMEQQDSTLDSLDLPNRVRDEAHLEQLLLKALDSPTHEVTDETFEEMRQEVRRRHAVRHPA